MTPALSNLMMPATPTQAVGRRMDGGKPSAMRGEGGREAPSFRQLTDKGTQQDADQAQEAVGTPSQAGGQDQPALDEQVSTPANLRDLLKKLRQGELPVEVTWAAAVNNAAPSQDVQISDAVARQLGFADADALAAAVRAARQPQTTIAPQANTTPEAKAALAGQSSASQAAPATAVDADPTQTAQTQQVDATGIAVDAMTAGENTQAATDAEAVRMQTPGESADAVAAVQAAATQSAADGTPTEAADQSTPGNVDKQLPQATPAAPPIVAAGPVDASAAQAELAARSDAPTTTPTPPQTPTITQPAPQTTEQAGNETSAAASQHSAQQQAASQQAAVAVAAEAAAPRKATQDAPEPVTTQTQSVADNAATPVVPPRNRLAETLAARFQQMSNETNQSAAAPRQSSDASRFEQGLASQTATTPKQAEQTTDAVDTQPSRVVANDLQPAQPVNAQAQQNSQTSMADGLVRAAADTKTERPADSATSATDVFASPEASEARNVAAAPGIATASAQAAGKSVAVDQVTTAIRYQATANTRELTVQMDPPELGKVHIQIRSEGGELRGVVQVDSARTFDDLQREAPQLLERLQEAGIRVKDLEFQMNDSGRGNHGQPHGQQAQNAYAEFSQGDGHRGQAWAADGEGSGRAGTMFDGEDAGEVPRGDGQYVGSGTLNVMI